MGPGVEMIKKEFEDLLPVLHELKFKTSTTNMDFILMALSQFKGTKLQKYTTNGVKVVFETQTTSKHHIIQVNGLQKDKAVVDKIANSLQGFVNSEIKPQPPTPTPPTPPTPTPPTPVIKPAPGLPTEVFTSTFDESLKGPFKIKEAIKVLKQKYNKIIKDIDFKKPGKVIVTYWKFKLPEGQAPTDEAPDWHYVRNLVEGSIPHQILIQFFIYGDTEN